MWSACDLHVHTRFSGDCQTRPEAIGAAALARGISMVAITDHHDVRGWRPAWNAAPRGVMVQPGVELTCPDGQSAVHIIGVFRRVKDFDEQKFINTLELAPGRERGDALKAVGQRG